MDYAIIKNDKVITTVEITEEPKRKPYKTAVQEHLIKEFPDLEVFFNSHSGLLEDE